MPAWKTWELSAPHVLASFGHLDTLGILRARLLIFRCISCATCIPMANPGCTIDYPWRHDFLFFIFFFSLASLVVPLGSLE